MLGVLACALGQGCATSAPATSAVPAAQKRPFVPPFAYEAYVRGELALAAQRPDQALLQFELATAAPEEDAFLLSRLAEAHAQAGDRESALRTLADAERVDSCEPEIWLTRGRWAEADQDEAAAELAYRRALACAPDAERARVALYRALRAGGREAEALKLLSDPGGAGRGPNESVRLLHALAHDDVAAARFALDSWLDAGGLSGAERERVLATVAARAEPSLSLAFMELQRVEALVRGRGDQDAWAQLALQSLDLPRLRALLAEHGEGALGGPERAARYALVARDYERADLYATLALNGAANRAPSDLLRALKVEALSALGQADAALEETRALRDPALQRRLARAQLARLGLPALAEELGAQ
jgi:tetratricopeptide (TPR) repeat protein